MKGLPNLTAQTAQAASAVAKFAADQAAAAGSAKASDAASDALAQAQECVQSLIALETMLAETEDLAQMSDGLADTLEASARALRAAGEAFSAVRR